MKINKQKKQTKTKNKTPAGDKNYCTVLCHERLGIVDPGSGNQPIFNDDKTIALSVNG
jgi:asparagine synthetase B (glutamine-hydrolysing)